MKKFTLWLSMMTFSFFATMQTAEAKRFGGGSSFGYSKKMAPKQYNTAPKPAAKSSAGSTTTAAGAKTSGASRFLGPLAGIAAGGLLAAMLFGDGFEGIQLLDILLIALLVFMLISLLRRRASAHQTAYSGHSGQGAASYDATPSPYQTREAATTDYSSHTHQTGESIIGSGLSGEAEPVLVAPDWFDEARFVEDAKSHFVAVQKAWDALDAKELQDYCTPELYNALKVEMAQLQVGTNHTEVDELNAEIADLAIDGDNFIVSVRFSGFIKEDVDGFAHAFNEIWHIRRLAEGRGPWQIAGIQQNDL
ncbi:Tim44 domain-containing protein [Thiomicrospira sp. XS5]|uniref:Tim44 domain-containing protein n=1 Tax=Thiomicrospira sp. XS5 TaxID=1775636 RepID=UPI000AD66DD8|nr:TIM44-like domain-containing protein [Thiomicrospira sp. XS5]